MRLIFVLMFVTLCSFFQNEKYYVTFVKGTVKLQRNRSPVKIGDALGPTDQLIFVGKDAKVSCISPGKGRFDLSAGSAKTTPDGEALATLKNALIPAPGSYHLSTRALGSTEYDPKSYFRCAETGDRICLVTDEPLAITSDYKRDSQNFFFLQYTINGKTLARKVKQNASGITFTDDLFPEGIPSKAMLCYQSISAGRPVSSIIAEFQPAMVSKSTLKQELEVIAHNSGLSDQKILKQELAAHVYANYGKIGSEVLTTIYP